MLNVNFMPRWQKTTIIYGIVFCIAILSIAIHYYCKQLQSKTEQEIKTITEEVQKLNAELNNPAVFVKKNKKTFAIPLIIRFLNHITETLPIGVYCNSISRNSRHWVVHGRSQNVNALTEWLTNLKNLSLFATLKSLEFNEKNIDFPVEFRMKITEACHPEEHLSLSSQRKLRSNKRSFVAKSAPQDDSSLGSSFR